MIDVGSIYRDVDLDYNFKVLRILGDGRVVIEDQGETRIVNQLLMEVQIQNGDLVKEEVKCPS